MDSEWGIRLNSIADLPSPFALPEREAGREIHLAPYLKLTDWAVKPQISSLILFLVFFVLALGIIAMMIRWMIVGWRNGAAEN